MSNPQTPNDEQPQRLTELEPEVQELTAEDAENVAGGLPAIQSVGTSAVKITDGTSNTASFSWGISNQIKGE